MTLKFNSRDSQKARPYTKHETQRSSHCYSIHRSNVQYHTSKHTKPIRHQMGDGRQKTLKHHCHIMPKLCHSSPSLPSIKHLTANKQHLFTSDDHNNSTRGLTHQNKYHSKDDKTFADRAGSSHSNKALNYTHSTTATLVYARSAFGLTGCSITEGRVPAAASMSSAATISDPSTICAALLSASASSSNTLFRARFA